MAACRSWYLSNPHSTAGHSGEKVVRRVQYKRFSTRLSPHMLVGRGAAAVAGALSWTLFLSQSFNSALQHCSIAAQHWRALRSTHPCTSVFSVSFTTGDFVLRIIFLAASLFMPTVDLSLMARMRSPATTPNKREGGSKATQSQPTNRNGVKQRNCSKTPPKKNTHTHTGRRRTQRAVGFEEVPAYTSGAGTGLATQDLRVIGNLPWVSAMPPASHLPTKHPTVDTVLIFMLRGLVHAEATTGSRQRKYSSKAGRSDVGG